MKTEEELEDAQSGAPSLKIEYDDKLVYQEREDCIRSIHGRLRPDPDVDFVAIERADGRIFRIAKRLIISICEGGR